MSKRSATKEPSKGRAPSPVSSRVPGSTWSRYVASEEAGYCSGGLAAARDISEEIGSAAVVIVHDGAILDAWGEVKRRFMCHSVPIWLSCTGRTPIEG